MVYRSQPGLCSVNAYGDFLKKCDGFESIAAAPQYVSALRSRLVAPDVSLSHCPLVRDRGSNSVRRIVISLERL